MSTRPIQSQFKIYEEHANQENYFNKLIDERAFFEVFPREKDYEMLPSTIMDRPAYARENLTKRTSTLMRIFEKNARTYNTTKNTIQYRLYTDGDIRGSLVENLESGSDYVGIHTQEFQLKLDVSWFGPNNVVIFEGFKEVPILILSEPRGEGQGWIYRARLIDSEISGKPVYLPDEALQPGNRVIQIGSFIGEAQDRRGPIHFGAGDTYMDFEVPMSAMGWEMEVTDKALLNSKNIRIKKEDPATGRKTEDPDVLFNNLEMKFMSETNFQKDMWLTYGRTGGNVQGKYLDELTERSLDIGPGFFEFLSRSNIIDYPVNGGSIDMIGDWLNSLWVDKVDPSQRNVDVYCGSGSLRVVNRWLNEKNNDYNIQRTPEYEYGEAENISPDRRGLALNKSQFTKIYLEPFGSITFKYLPILDSLMVESRKYRGYPIPSYDMLVFDYGYGKGMDSNIVLLKNEQREQYGYICGGWCPLGPTLSPGKNYQGRFHTGLGSANKFKYIHDTVCGILVKDPSYIAWFRPNID